MDKSKAFVLWFDEITIEDIPLVGGKNASLGEMYQTLVKKGVRIPNGFAVTAYAYRYVLEKSGALEKLRSALRGLNVKNVRALAAAGRKARDIIMHCEFPPELESEILHAYQKLSKEYRDNNTDVAVRSSATAEDLPEASFAGQQESFLNVRGHHELIDCCKRCFASLFTNRAIAYRTEHGFDHFKVYLSIGVQKMVRSDLACAGVIFTLDTETGFPNVVFVTGSYGLGESVVQGAVNPDEFYVFKPTLKDKFKPLIDKRLGEKATKIVYTEEGTRPIKKVDTPIDERSKFCLNDDEVLTLAKWAMIIEDHYTKKKNRWCPMDIEWAKDGRSNQLFIVQARPETVQSQKNRNIVEEYKMLQKGSVLAVGKSVGNKIAQGRAHVIKDVKEIFDFKPGEVLITEMTDPDWVPIMRIASAIVTNRGGRTSHAAIVSRELGLPCIVGTNDGTHKVKTGQKVTVSCAEGEHGVVYDGFLKFKVDKVDIQKMPRTKTKVMINIGNPDEAFELSFLPNDGVGLAREEFIVNEYIKIHPMALIDFKKVEDAETKKKIEELTAGYKDKKQFFVDKLAMGVGMLAAAFYPKDVILRFSDFKTNEYVNLIGGKYFEPHEENPMIGWRGASRYYKPGYKDGFALECKAIKKVREEFGLTNLKVMVPVCRTPEEGRKVLKVMKENGLQRGKNGLQVYVMCEIPSNVVLADEFCDIFDGFSIGSNDLTQMTLGVDRDSELVADIYDERNEAVERLVQHVIGVAKQRKRKIGICGDAPSTYPEFAEFLVDCGIDSISLSPDAVVGTTLVIANHEKKLK
ncbi:phosphoenolpyruvate synthase [Candidatus Woesearchaeota archaeon]|nr:phosphoenolpyruvate synthase [Candidatus Woesearchaeota archaeon]MBW3016420.1 phosphoenolpyruvate synthase [Candidatus Woesearchaeota archaeon]